jgi:hypothetical protein
MKSCYVVHGYGKCVLSAFILLYFVLKDDIFLISDIGVYARRPPASIICS